MYLRLIPNCFRLLLLSIVLITGCVKNPLTGIPSGNDDPPEITATGTPTGTPITKTIGTSGGSLVSADGKLTITIPAGALNSNLDITIQPITNEVAGGISDGYDLLPSGTSFNIPVTLNYHYTNDDVRGTHPYFMYIATQDSTGAWTGNLLERDLDTVGMTVSINIPHFSSYALASSLRAEFSQTELHSGESNSIQVMQTLTKGEQPIYNTNADDNLLTALPIHKKQLVPNDHVGHWNLNGQDTTKKYGTVSGTGGDVTFTAPGNIDGEQAVRVTTEITGPFVVYIKRKKILLSAITLVDDVSLIPNKYSFDVKIEYHQAGTNDCFIDNYMDGATLQVDIENDVITVSNIINQNPTASPTSGPDNTGTTTCSKIAENIGMVNIISASGTVSTIGSGSGEREYALLMVNHQGTVFPEWLDTDLNGVTSQTGGYALPGFPQTIGIVLRDSVQVTSISAPVVGTGQTADGKITITPKH